MRHAYIGNGRNTDVFAVCADSNMGIEEWIKISDFLTINYRLDDSDIKRVQHQIRKITKENVERNIKGKTGKAEAELPNKWQPMRKYAYSLELYNSYKLVAENNHYVEGLKEEAKKPENFSLILAS